MAASLPSPPESRETTPQNLQDENNRLNLTRRLDQLLEQYLELLDQYTALREEISKSLADGYFSLARAQHTSSLGPGRRYGQDGYDDRMKASRRVNIVAKDVMEHTEHSSKKEIAQSELHTGGIWQKEPSFTIVALGKGSDFRQNEPLVYDSQASKPKSQTRTENVEHSSEHKLSNGAVMSTNKTKTDPGYRDPATWYGILVPQMLRQAQQFFSVSIDGTIPKLLNIRSSMSDVESQIHAIREKIGQGTDRPSSLTDDS